MSTPAVTSTSASPTAIPATGTASTASRCTPAGAVAGLWQAAGMPAAALGQLQLAGADPLLPSSFAVGTAAQASVAAAALAAATLWWQRSGRWQAVAVDMRHALAEFRSERYLRVDGAPAPEFRDSLTGVYRCGDGRWLRVHANFPHHRDGVLRLLGCAHTLDAVRAALGKWEAEGFEAAAAEAGLVVAAMRSFAQWDSHSQGQVLGGLPPLTLERIGDAPPQPLPALPEQGARPLSGVRVLDFTRIIAGPVAGRTLAAHGADVLLVSAAHLPSIAPLVIDTGRGKRACQLDLRDPDDKRALHKLLHGADVLVQAYRPQGLAALGVGPEAAARARPGLVYVTLSAYGHLGPWAGRRGFDSLVQTAAGFNHAEAQAAGGEAPLALPAQVLDHAAGYLLALGAMAALYRRATEGGSWHVRVSLAQVAHWLRGLGRVEGGLLVPDQQAGDVADLMATMPSGFGELSVVSHAARLSETPAYWALPSVSLGTHAPVWPLRA